MDSELVAGTHDGGRAALATAAGPAGLTEALAADADLTPASIDLAPIFAQWGLATRCQGERGTCSVFVVTDAIEYAIANDRRQATRLSVEFLNWASNQTTKTPRDGGFFSDLWNGCAQFGICPDVDMPYLDRFDPAVQPSEQALAHAKRIKSLGLQLHWIKEWNPHRGLTDDQLAGIKVQVQLRVGRHATRRGEERR